MNIKIRKYFDMEATENLPSCNKDIIPKWNAIKSKVFDQIDKIVAENKALKEEIGKLKDRTVYITANPETESGTWYKDQAGNEFYLQKRESLKSE